MPELISRLQKSELCVLRRIDAVSAARQKSKLGQPTDVVFDDRQKLLLHFLQLLAQGNDYLELNKYWLDLGAEHTNIRYDTVTIRMVEYFNEQVIFIKAPN